MSRTIPVVPNSHTFDVLVPGYNEFLPVLVSMNHVTHIEPLKPTEGRDQPCVMIHLVSGVRLIALGDIG